MAKNKNEKKNKKLGLKGVLIAIVVAILSLLGFGWNGTDWGQGNIGDQDQSGQVESDSQTDSQTDADSQEDTSSEGEETDMEEEEKKLAFYVYEDRIYSDETLTSEVSLVEIEVMLEAYEGKEVFLYDSGAVKQTYEEVEKVIDIYVDSHGFIKVKSEIE